MARGGVGGRPERPRAFAGGRLLWGMLAISNSTLAGDGAAGKAGEGTVASKVRSPREGARFGRIWGARGGGVSTHRQPLARCSSEKISPRLRFLFLRGGGSDHQRSRAGRASVARCHPFLALRFSAQPVPTMSAPFREGSKATGVNAPQAVRIVRLPNVFPVERTLQSDTRSGPAPRADPHARRGALRRHRRHVWGPTPSALSSNRPERGRSGSGRRLGLAKAASVSFPFLCSWSKRR